MGLINTGRSVYHALRRLPERVRHRARRRAALARQSVAGRPQRVLILCYGNICRSPYAEARLRRLLDERKKDPQVELGFDEADRRMMLQEVRSELRLIRGRLREREPARS